MFWKLLTFFREEGTRKNKKLDFWDELLGTMWSTCSSKEFFPKKYILSFLKSSKIVFFFSFHRHIEIVKIKVFPCLFDCFALQFNFILKSIVYSHDRKEDGDRNLQPEALILELDFTIINLWEKRKQQEIKAKYQIYYFFFFK